jgi:hypothetical protein
MAASGPALAVVTANGNRREREVVQVPANALQVVDLDLLAGSGYSGAYSVTSSGPLSQLAASSSTSVRATSPSAHWFMAAVPGPLTFTNTALTATSIQLVAWAPSGTILDREALSVARLGSVAWSPPRGSRPGRVALTVDGGAPVVISDADGPAPAVPEPRGTWYAMHPPATLTLFNPAAVPATVHASFLGSSAVKSVDLSLLPDHSFPLSSHGASAVALSSTVPIAAGYATADPATSQPTADAVTQTAMAAAGTTTHLDLYNPSAQQAHVALTILTGGAPSQITVTIAPAHLRTVQARRANGPAGGIAVSSDVPVVAATR